MNISEVYFTGSYIHLFTKFLIVRALDNYFVNFLFERNNFCITVLLQEKRAIHVGLYRFQTTITGQLRLLVLKPVIWLIAPKQSTLFRCHATHALIDQNVQQTIRNVSLVIKRFVIKISANKYLL